MNGHVSKVLKVKATEIMWNVCCIVTRELYQSQDPGSAGNLGLSTGPQLSQCMTTTTTPKKPTKPNKHKRINEK